MRKVKTYKIYRLTTKQLILFEVFVDVLLWYQEHKPVWKYVLSLLSKIIITPSGIRFDRRTQAHPFRAVERRLVNILRYKLYIWLYGNDDTEGVS